ncbi:MAG: molybdopterin biosynthesis protein, partial [Candidatus Kariarchaeaceae archaeon]
MSQSSENDKMTTRKIFRKLVSVSEARKSFYEYAPKSLLPSECVDLLFCLGRVLASDIFSPLDVPPFDRAAMDGFAIRSSDTTESKEDHATVLKVMGSIKAGYVFDKIIEDGSCVEISTGAPLPAGADSVVMVEYTNRIKNKVEIFQATTPGENVMSAGADIQKGERVLAAGIILTSRELAVLAAMGFAQVDVIKKPKIGIFSSGDEIATLGQALEPGKLYDINATAIAASVME